ncbi:uncharacterized protein AMSG_04893 [Thecamonas trahens ATCC 50062]|uniref:Chromo domain-containing protein n=1 Tax=Thecamonas trahens ATCC 50062 TaxID=461836 RepID=A0A0L0D7T5_THETB|nr:hypothetical protein AMSG_04893 [Thecamonas trahens ATCC 50062]KNC48447.1 hypothetical protein AMSG_04893 [Thecamonas trahens ATCC 50062]|eukprot:XP_013758560.1 hypothetical protein AMSG_04893 [Thecamonas trahens ATCC 50062]
MNESGESAFEGLSLDSVDLDLGLGMGMDMGVVMGMNDDGGHGDLPTGEGGSLLSDLDLPTMGMGIEPAASPAPPTGLTHLDLSMLGSHDSPPRSLHPALVAATPAGSIPSTPLRMAPSGPTTPRSARGGHPHMVGTPRTPSFPPTTFDGGLLPGSGLHVAEAAAERLNLELNHASMARYSVNGLEGMVPPSPFASPSMRRASTTDPRQSLAYVAGTSGLSSMAQSDSNGLGASPSHHLSRVAEYPDTVRAGLAASSSLPDELSSGATSSILDMMLSDAIESEPVPEAPPQLKYVRRRTGKSSIPRLAGSSGGKLKLASSSKAGSKRKRSTSHSAAAAALSTTPLFPIPEPPRKKPMPAKSAAAPQMTRAAALASHSETFVPPKASHSRVYEVEVLGTKLVNGVCFHLVHYVGFPSTYDTWQASSSLQVLEMQLASAAS